MLFPVPRRQAAEELAGRLQASDPAIRFASLAALVELELVSLAGDVEPVLRKMLSSEDTAVRRAAARGVKMATKPPRGRDG